MLHWACVLLRGPATCLSLRFTGKPAEACALTTFRYCSGTIAENIAYGCSAPLSQEELVEAARAANALSFIEKAPDGFSTQVPTCLSGPAGLHGSL